jgi:hypothetical protein
MIATDFWFGFAAGVLALAVALLVAAHVDKWWGMK